jgi:Skp family chaperone for outer membrane proteins
VTRHTTSLALIAAAFSLALVGPNLCSAEDAAKPTTRKGTVAVLDITAIFKESKRFNAEMTKMKDDVAKATENVKKEQDKIKAQTEELEKLPSGSEERLKQEEYIAKVQAALAASVNLQKQTFLRREAAVYYDIYKRIDAEVETYAKENGIEVVIRTAKQTVDSSKPDSVLSYVNKPVVWTSPEADITAAIAERLEKHDDSPVEDKKDSPAEKKTEPTAEKKKDSPKEDKK